MNPLILPIDLTVLELKAEGEVKGVNQSKQPDTQFCLPTLAVRSQPLPLEITLPNGRGGFCVLMSECPWLCCGLQAELYGSIAEFSLKIYSAPWKAP